MKKRLNVRGHYKKISTGIFSSKRIRVSGYKRRFPKRIVSKKAIRKYFG
jgi:hypothetical protein